MATTFGTWAAHLALSPSSGDIHYFTDSFYNEAYYDGAKWRYLLHGKEMVPPTSGSFSWVNQTSGGKTASVDHSHGGEHMVAPALSGDHYRVRIEAAPSPPYKVRATVLMSLAGADFAVCGIVWRESSSGKLVIPLVVNSGSAVWPHIAKGNSATDFSPGAYNVNLSVSTMTSSQLLHFELEDDNANRIVRLSADGINFNQAHAVGRTDFLTANEIGWCVNANNATYAAAGTLINWQKL